MKYSWAVNTSNDLLDTFRYLKVKRQRYSKDLEDLILVSEVGGFLAIKITEEALELLTRG